MKKTLLILLISFVSLPASAQTFKPDEFNRGELPKYPKQILDTVVISELKKDQIYSNALGFITSTFNDSRDVIQMKDQQLGEIVFNGNISKNYLKEHIDKKGKKTLEEDKVTLFFKCNLYIKDEKYKISLSSLEYDFSPYLKTNMQLIVSDEPASASNRNTIAINSSIDLIKRIATGLNKKPKNDF